MNPKMDRGLYLYIMKQLAEDLPDGLSDRDDPEDIAKFGQRFEEMLKIGYELNDPESCDVEIYSAMPEIRAVLDDDQWAALLNVISDKGDIQLIRIKLFGEPLIETGRFHKCPPDNALLFMQLPSAILKGVVKGLVQGVRDNGLGIIDAYRGTGNIKGKVDVDDTFAQLLREVLDDEIEETVSEFRQSLMAEVSVAQFTPWGPPSTLPHQPPGGGEST